ncbi:MAG TPA: prenyltransferase/squalene oxidase repeat-containing protein [Planctomycetota bacterium]|nr:prenyltransferase/squalene oxidase repeat-containing protein [Planctomycetota bacterium]
MHESQEPQTLGNRLAATPWLMTAIMLHVAAVAIASILYYTHGSAIDDAMPTEVALTTRPPAMPEFAPPEIIDRLTVPQIAFDEIPTTDNPFDALQDEKSEQTNEADITAELAGMRGNDGGATAIGAGEGHYGPVPSPFGGRPGGPGKYGNRPTGGGPSSDHLTDDAVMRGLLWLKNHQDADGRWDADQFMKHDVAGDPCTGPGNAGTDVGVTGLALLAFLGRGNTLREGPFREVVRSGMRWLVDQQDESGRIGEPASQSYMYSHAIATLAICEAYGLSDIAGVTRSRNYSRLRKPAQNAINFIVQARNPYGVWRYEPKCADGDTSITAWMVQALLSAKEFELLVDDAALKSATVWFDSVTDTATGASGYTRLGDGSSRPVGKQNQFPSARSEALTAAVLLCRYLMHQEPKDVPTMSLAAETMLKKPPVWNEADGSIDMYYWYYASYALYQAGGKPWDTWSKKMVAASIKTQRQDGNAKGSWDPVDAWGEDGGRVYATAIMVLILEAQYRYARVLGGR